MKSSDFKAVPGSLKFNREEKESEVVIDHHNSI